MLKRSAETCSNAADDGTIYVRLGHEISPSAAAAKFVALPHCLLLESALQQSDTGRYSFLMADPFEFATWQTSSSKCLDWLDARLKRFQQPPIDGLPPFQGGVAGLFSYEFNHNQNHHSASQARRLPIAALGCYDVAIAWDHETNDAWLISTGFPELDPDKRKAQAERRMQSFLACLRRPEPERTQAPATVTRHANSNLEPIPASYLRAVQIDNLDANRYPALCSNLSKDAYIKMIESGLEYIRAGDLFQVNLAQQLWCPAVDDAWQLYGRLRDRNAAPFASYFDLGKSQIVSASPERLVSLRDGLLESRPIKGTRRRNGNPDVDRAIANELRACRKDCAENTMIVDLIRNDLSRVATDDSVRVTQYLGLEAYESVIHLVSAIEAQWEPQDTVSAIVRALFPGGSITGAPKIRAMEVITELEPHPRDAYCGSIGYFGFNRSIDLNILIRTITAHEGLWQIPVGGGIVAESDPAQEYEETWTKAAGLLNSLHPQPVDKGEAFATTPT